MGTVRIPDLRVTLPISHGTSDNVLSKGAGHIYGTSLPVGGASTHTAISAHSALAQMTGFDRLIQLPKGSVFYLDVMGETLAYKVVKIEAVLPEQLDRLKVEQGKDLATLVTCTPYGINSHRLLVTGERIPYDKAQDDKSLLKSFDWMIQDWMWMRLIVGGLALALLLGCMVMWLRTDAKRRKELKAARAVLAGHAALVPQSSPSQGDSTP